MRLDAIILFLFVCLFGSFKLSAQTYNYTYTDPCTGNDKTIIVPINGNVTVGYYGVIGSFSYNDFSNGNFESWASNIFSQYGTNSPCSEIVGLGTAVNITQSTALNVIGILNSLSTIAEIAGSTNILGGAVSSVSNSGNSGGSKKNKGNNKNNGEGSNNNAQGNVNNAGSNQNSSQGQENSGSNQGNTGGVTQGGGESGLNPSGNTQAVTPVNNNTATSTGTTGSSTGTTGSSTGTTGTSSGNPESSNGASTGNTGTATGTTGTSSGNPESSNGASAGTTGTTSGNNTQSGAGNTNGGGTSETTQTTGNSTTTQTTGNSTTQQGGQSNEQAGTGAGSKGTGGEQTNNQSAGNGESSNNGSNGNNGNTGNSGNGSGNNNSNGQTEEGQTNTQSEQGQGKTNITAGASTTIKSTPTSKEGGKPTVVGSADFIGFNFKNSEVRTGAKATGGYTSMRWDGKRSYGALVDYTSALKGPNITTFYAWIRPKSIILASGTLTIGFEGNKSLYGTFAAGQMFNLKKPKNLKLLYMGTVSYGSVYRESFLGTALIVGAMYDFRVGKRFDIKLMNLFVYAPYVSYYNDVVLKSPYVMLPSIGTNIKISKKFKFNINGGGAWDLKTSALNYTITCGTRFVIGQ